MSYRHPNYKLYMVFGKKGSGKSTYMVKLAYKYHKAGVKVYCTSYIPFTYYIPDSLIGKVALDEGSVLLVDEVGMLWDNRQFKTFPTYLRDWFKLQRHYKITVYLFSQSFDIDKKIRDLTDEMLLIRKYFGFLSIGRRILRKVTLTSASDFAGSTIADELKFDLLLLPGSCKFTFLPRWRRYFDSFDAPVLDPYDAPYTDYKSFRESLAAINKSK